jgi:hypothetical protein
MAQLRSATAPRSALVVGKVHLYRDRSGVGTVSVRAEAVRTVSEAEERAALAEAVRHTLDRLDLLDRIEKGTALSDADARREGVPVGWVHAARDALRRYPTVDRPAFRRELGAAVRRVAGDSGPQSSAVAPTVTVVRAPPPKPPSAAPSPAERQEESVFLDLLDEVAEVSTDGYADLRELFARVQGRGVAAERAEATLNRLEEEGVVEEPVVGKLRRA